MRYVQVISNLLHIAIHNYHISLGDMDQLILITDLTYVLIVKLNCCIILYVMQ